MRKNVLVGLVVLVLFSGLVCASFEIDEDSTFVETNYYAGNFVQGQLNISFDKHNGLALFESNFEGEISVFDLLEANGYVAGKDFTCSPVSCDADYGISELYSGSEVEFNLDEKKVYGLKVEGEEVSISQFSAEIYSGGQKSCSNQIYIDMFNDGSVDLFNTHYRDQDCGPANFGCFDNRAYGGVASLGTTNVCERVELDSAPAYRIGAMLDLQSDPDDGTIGNVNLILLDEDGNKACGDKSGASGVEPDSDEISVIVDCSFVEDFVGYVCISMSDPDDVGHKIKFEQDENACGAERRISGLHDMDTDYEIFAQPLAFDQMGTAEIHEVYADLYEKDIAEAVDEYIAEKYDRDCSGENGCVIPIGIWRGDTTDLGLDHVVSLTNGFIEYKRGDVGGGLVFTADTFYLLEKDDFKITSNYTVLDLYKMEIEVPREEGEQTFELDLGSRRVLREKVDIEVGFDFGILPRFALQSRETVFAVSGVDDVSTTRWSWGDGTSDTLVQGKSATHIFSEGGEYVIKVLVTNSAGEVSPKNFKIFVGEPKASADLVISDYESRMKNIKDKLSEYPDWFEAAVSEELGLDSISSSIQGARNDYETLSDAASESNYIEIINSVLELDLPRNFLKGDSGQLPAEIGFPSIELGNLIAITGEEVNNEMEVRNGVIDWMNTNYNIMVNYEVFSVLGDEDVEEVLTKYRIDLTKKGGSDVFSYLIIDWPKNSVRFKMNYDSDTIEGGSAVFVPIDREGSPGSIEFVALGGNVPRVQDFGIYLSPRISDLNVANLEIREPDPGEFPWGKVLIWLFVLLVVLLGIYLLLQMWYKKKYENYLFKNPNELYNLINFIYNSRSRKMSDQSIRQNLKRSKWGNEQITYAFKKLDGKRTGMWEIPIFKFLENRRVKSELQKRNPGQNLNARFIKTPGVY